MRKKTQWMLPVTAALLMFLNVTGAARGATSCGAKTSCTATSSHTIQVVNKCSIPLWVANAANIVGGAVIGGKACTQNSDCCVTLASGTVDCTGATCGAAGFCSQINCTASSQCPSSSSGLTACNVPVGVQCSGDADCATYSCKADSDCPPNATCTNKVCQGMCQSNVCACRTSGPGCPGAGSTCDAAAGTTAGFGMCAGGACQYQGLVPEKSQWKVASGQSSTMCMPAGWGGRIWARTGCTKTGSQLACQTGQCGQGASASLACTNVASGVANTATGVTLFEGTWDSGAAKTDFWDVSLVNGHNVPMAVDACVANGGQASCTFAGGTSTATDVGCVAGQNLNTTCPPLLAVSGQANCASNADCGTGGTCGPNNLCTSTKGIVACIDPGDLCKGFGLFGGSTAVAAPACLQCNTVVDATTNPAATYNDFFNCVGDLATLSCNNAAIVCFSDTDCPYSGQTCQNQICQPINSLNGSALCQNGACDSNVNHVAQYECKKVGTQQLCLPQPPSTSSEGCCGPFNPLWTTAGKAAAGSVTGPATACMSGTTPYAAAFKSACPTAYSYQFDDPSSSFQCSSLQAPVNYQVTFCP